MCSSQEERTAEVESFDQLRYSYTQLTKDHDRLRMYNDLQIKFLEYYKITYPPYYSPNEIVS
jgi:hypothetical protein